MGAALTGYFASEGISVVSGIRYGRITADCEAARLRIIDDAGAAHYLVRQGDDRHRPGAEYRLVEP